MPCEHVPQVNVQFHMVVVLKNTMCGKHMTKVAQPVPAVRAVNLLSLETSNHHQRVCTSKTSNRVEFRVDVPFGTLLKFMSNCRRQKRFHTHKCNLMKQSI
jgi:hypothetical protein